MLKFTFSTLVALLLLVKINAQEIDPIKAWQQQHPNVVFVSNESYQNMSPSERERLENLDVILFKDEIKLEDLHDYENNNGLKNDVQVHYTNEELKQWISEHDEVKLIKQSAYMNSPESIQEEYHHCSYCLIMKGEFLTLSDISNYESEKH